MRMCIISDTHGYHDAVKIPDADILVHCGDNTNYGEIWEFKKFLIWLGNQKPKHKVFINGNHEVIVWKKSLAKTMVKEHNKGFLTNIHYLEEEGVEIEGLKFWGTPYSPEFFDWAYMYNREDGARKYIGVPEDTDVLITHGPPAGVLDKVKPFGRYDREHAGCDYLMEKVKEIKPKVHAFGHIHHTYGWKKFKAPFETLFVNAATCNARYIPVNPPIVVDTDSWEVVL